jgi:gliding motility-associated-like protein
MKDGFFRNIFIATILLFISGTTLAQNPFIPKYDAVKRSERCFTVTDNLNNQFGSVWWADKVDFSTDTLFNFVVYMGDRDGNGADGLAFVMHRDPRDTITDVSQTVNIGGNPSSPWPLSAATGDDGGGLGYAMHNSRVGPNTIPGPHGPGDDPENHKIQPSVAIEIDTWDNNDVQDGRSGNDGNGIWQPTSPFKGMDHTSVVYNGDVYGGQQQITDANGNTDRILPLKPSYVFGSANNIEDDRCYTFQVRWITNSDGTQTLELWEDIYDGTTNTTNLQMIMTHTDDMINNVFGGNTLMRFGFSGSTGGARNEQTICLLGENLQPFAADDFASIPANTSQVIDVEANDNDPDGDVLHVPVIISPPQNGSAVIFDSLNINFLRYTPNLNYTGADSLVYVTCDVNSTKCYAKCDTAVVRINVGCIPFDVTATQTSPNEVCSDSVPANGVATANAVSTLTTVLTSAYNESFEDLNNGDTEDTGTTAWTRGGSGCNGIRRVSTIAGNKKFRISNSNCEVVWETEVIDISNLTDVLINVDLESPNTNKMENSDYLRAYYVLDGGSETALVDGIHRNDIRKVVRAFASGINGSTLKIVIRARNSSSNENYYWDNITVNGYREVMPTYTYNWYDGISASGPIIYTGTILNGVTDGDYSVIAINDVTGCPSNPATLTIDSLAIRVNGGFVEQLAPFTNCALPYDGELGAGIFDGIDTLTTGYTYEWYHQEDPKIPSFIQRTGAIATNLESREYSVIITDVSTGCDTTLTAEVVNEVVIPTVTANAIAHVTSCSDPNTGIGEAHVASDTTGFFFEWYAGPAIGAGPPNFTTARVNTFTPGTYTVQATDTTTSCTSEARSITINDETVTPDILVSVVSEQISCDTAAFTGQLSGTVNENGTPTTIGYTFNWYKGPNDIIPARDGYTGGPTADSLDAGQYRLVVVADGTDCTAFVDTLVQDNTVTPPDLTLTPTHVSSCGTPNGIIDIGVSGDPMNYYFEIYNGLGVTSDSLLLTSNGTNITGLDIGNYTVIAIDNGTKCATNPATTTINDFREYPVPDYTVTHNSSCDTDPANQNGAIQVTHVNAIPVDPALYRFKWYDGNSTTGTLFAGQTSELISGLDDGTKALVITDDATECSNEVAINVNDIINTPVITNITTTDATRCAEPFLSSATATVTDAIGTTITYVWENSDLPLTLAGATTNTINDNNSGESYALPPGNYSLTVENEFKCSSTQAFVINENTVTPVPDYTVTHNSSCDTDPANQNGAIQVTHVNAIPVDPALYRFKWYDGNSTTGTLFAGQTSELISGLDDGTKALVITDDATECSNEVAINVNDIINTPVITNITTTDATRCAEPFLSSATATVTDAIGTTITYVWENSDLPLTLAGATTNTINDNNSGESYALPPGNYSLTVENEFKCSSTQAFVINENTVTPVPDYTVTHNSSCDTDPANQNGAIQVTHVNAIPVDPALYRFKWYDGNSTTGTLFAGQTSELISGLDDGTKALVITDDATECSNEVAINVNDIINTPVITNITTTDATRCAEPFLSSATATVTDAIGTTITYVWENSDLPLTLAGATTNTINDNNSGESYALPPGNYSLTVENEFKCSSTQAFVINENTVTPVPDYTVTHNSSCDTDPANQNGAIQVTHVNAIPVDPALYRFKWYDGNSTTGTLFAGQTSELISGLDDGTKALVITDDATECSNEVAINVNDIINTPVITNITTTDATRCAEPFLSSATATVTDAIGTTITYVWENSDLPLTLAGATTNTINDNNSGESYALPPGNYSLTVENEFKCSSTQAFVINENTVTPVPDYTVTHNSSCDTDPANQNGAIQVTHVNAIPVDPALYRFKWYDGNSTTGTLFAGQTSELISGLDDGTKALVITDDATECSNEVAINVNDIINTPVITNITTTDATRCAEPFLSSATATVTDAIGTTITYVWENSDLPLTLAGATTNTINDNNSGESYALPPGNYSLTVENEFKCSSTQAFVINENTVTPVPDYTVTHNSSCDTDPANQNGAIQVTHVNAIPVDPALYRFKWYDGNSTTGTLFAGQTSELISGLDDGTKALVITDDATECSNEVAINVNDIINTPVITNITTTDATRCAEPFLSSATATVTDAIGTTITYVWENSDLPLTLAGATTNTINDNNSGESYALPPGNYSLTVENEFKCSSTQAFVINENTVTPVPDYTVTHNSSCDTDPANQNGAIQVTHVNAIPVDPALYRFKWYDGNSTTGTLFAGQTSELISGLDDGTKALVITDDATECSNEVAINVNDIINTPVITNITTTDATRCAEPFLSSATATVTDAIGTTITYVWENSDLPLTLAGATTNTINDNNSGESYALPPGNYSLTVENEFKCSSTQAFVIVDNSVLPVFSLTANDNISCDPSKPEGSIIASRPDNTHSSFAYEWFDASGLIPSPITLSDTILTTLTAGIYAVELTNTTTECTSIREFATINNVQDVSPIIDNVHIKDLTSCLTPDGEVGWEVRQVSTIPYAPSINRTYSFYAVNSNSLAVADTASASKLYTDPLSGSPGLATFTGLTSGDWTALAVDNFSHCISASNTQLLEETPGVDIVKIDSLLPLACDGTDLGFYQFKAESAINPESTSDPNYTGKGFNFTWEYWGTLYSPGSWPASATPSTDPDSTNAFRERMNELPAGYYIVNAYDNETGCTASETFYLPVYNAPPSVLLAQSPASNCTPGNGEIHFKVEPVMDATGTVQLSGNANTYDVILFEGETVAGAKVITNVQLQNYSVQYHITSTAAGSYQANLPPGSYTLVTVENTVGNDCYSEPSVIEVELSTDDPTIDAVISDDITCNATGTGAINGDVEGADGDLVDFNYEWFAGNDTTGISISPALNINGLLAGTYTIKVVDTGGPGEGCRYKKSFNVSKTLIKREILHSINPNTNCAGFTGEVQIIDVSEDGTAVGGAAGYTDFEIYIDPTGAALESLGVPNSFTSRFKDGDFYLRAKHNNTDCLTDLLKVTVVDNSVNPIASLAQLSPDFACAGGTPTGQLTATINGGSDADPYNFATPGANFNISWERDGIAFLPTLDAASGLPVDLAAGSVYTLIVQDNAGDDLNCISEVSYTVTSDRHIIQVDATPVDQTICGPNGQIDINSIVELTGAASEPNPTNGWSLRLLDDTQSELIPFAALGAGVNASNYSGLNAGTYFLEAKGNLTNCDSDPIQVIIGDVSVNPIASLAQLSPDFACAGGTPTGQLTATINGGSDADPYNFATPGANFNISWERDGIAFLPTLDAASGLPVDLAAGSVYTLIVQDNAGDDLNCISEVSYTVTSDRHIIQVDATPVDQTICGPNGQIDINSIVELTGAASEPNPTNGWSLRLLDDTQSELIPFAALGAGVNASNYSGLNAGTYFLEAKGNLTNCDSDPIQVIIGDVSVNPIASLAQLSPDFACAGGTPTGQLTATINGGSDADPYNFATPGANFNISWERDGIAFLPTLDAASGLPVDLAAGSVYTLIVQDNAGDDLNCISEVSYTVTSDRHIIQVDATPVDQTICGPNGQIDINSIVELTGAASEPNPTNGWSLRLLDDTQSELIPFAALGAGVNASNYSGLNAGTYFLEAKGNLTNCDSDPIQVIIGDVSVNPIASLAQLSPDFACAGGTPTGQLTATINGGSDADPYNFATPGANFNISWERDGIAFLPTLDAASGLPVDLAAGSVYTLIVQDNAGDDLNCISEVSYTVTSDRHIIQVDATPVDQTICGPNGQIDINSIVELTGAASEPNPTNGWSLRLLDDTQSELIPFAALGAGVNASNYSGLNAGTYFLEAKGNLTNCDSDPIQVIIGDVSVNPIASLAQLSPDFACAGGTPTGQLTATINGGSDADPYNFATPGANFNISWERDGIAFLPTLDAASGLPVDLAAGSVYTLIVQDNAGDDLNCISEVSYTVTSDRHIIQVDATPVDQTICGPNGQIDINSIVELTGAASEPNPTNGWSLRLLDDTQSELIPFAALGAGVNASNYSGLNAGTYFLEAKGNLTNCDSDPIQVIIGDVSVNPIASLAQLSPDFACAGGTPTGQLTATINGGSDADPYNFATPGANFNISWERDGIAFLPTLDAASGLPVDLAAGSVYTLIVQDNAGDDLNCISEVSYTVTSDRHIIQVDATPVDQTICGPNGQIDINSIVELTGAASEPNPTNGWSLRLLDDTQSELIPFAALGAGVNASNYSGLNAGTYFLEAKGNLTNCDSDPIQVIIGDVSVNPIASLAQLSPDFACAGGTPTGQLTATINGGSDADPYNFATPGANFNISWERDGIAFLPTLDAASGLPVDLAAGSVYTLIVQDNAGDDLNCISEVSYTVTSDRHIIQVDATPVDQTICGPNGQIDINSIVELTGAASEPNPTNGWSLRLLDDTQSELIPFAALGAGVNASNYSGLNAGTYFLEAKGNLTNCDSDPIQVIIGDVSVDPIISVAITTPQYSLNSDPASWTGVLEATVTEQSTGLPGPSGYTYSWHHGTNTNSAVLSLADSLPGLDVGDYTVVARSNDTGCESSFTGQVPFVFLEPTFNTLVRPITVCSPDNGSIEVTDIALDGTADQLSDYTFFFHDITFNEGDTPDTTIPGDDTQTIYQDLATGSYYIIAREDLWMLNSYPIKVDVTDSTTNPIVLFDATNYHPLTSCDEVAFADGTLAVDVYEDLSNPYLALPPYNYVYSWYRGDEANPTELISGETNNLISGLPTGDYTVVVRNMGNNCESEQTFTIEDESIIPLVNVSQSPNMNCIDSVANGVASAIVINTDHPHEYRWYQGMDVSGIPDFVGQNWRDRIAGTYTVVAVDQQFGTCISEPVLIELRNEIEYPLVLINEVSPVTNCDPERPNGVLTAVTEDGVSGYTFDWYLDDQLYFTGPEPSNLSNQEYRLLVTNNNTLCSTAMNTTPSAAFTFVPQPEVSILSERTSCNEPNAIVTASIENAVTNHIFRYYNKYTGEELANYVEDYKIYNLDTSAYYVTAEDRTSGCVSSPTEFNISNETYFPEIEIETDASNCEDADGQANVIISDMTRDFNVTWYGENGFESQLKEIVYIPRGIYTVDVEGTDGCITTMTTEVKGDVKVYNGVSPNNDGMNDFFKITCLEHFPQNLVRIYNRAGVMVWEQEGYDIFTEKRFEGISNRGLSILGTELPIGTYFYVIEKNDGSKAKVGYLELKR